ncbi:TraB/GumN family protein [Altererythrobacter sp.]|uniref:TraB/GumN family protein n=1 Tax=Altererythrobacter sp. TaxID=1872480 RepID=UPI003D006613
MIRRLAQLALMLAGALALASCQKQAQPDGSETGASPILYQVSDASGAVRGWLFGTIHSLPDGTKWRTPQLNKAIDEAGLLVVEIKDLDDNAALRKVFATLAITPDQPDIAQRIPASDRPALFDLIHRSSFKASDFKDIETWAAALMLAQVDDTGNAANGADRALLHDFAGRDVVELEGTERQLGIFDTLPEIEQADLLLGVLEESKRRSQDPDLLRKAWLAGDAEAIEQAAREGILADPELRAALLVNRNRAWVEQLDPMLQSGQRPLVAVGTAHLLGDDGLPAMLEMRDYTLTRLQ